MVKNYRPAGIGMVPAQPGTYLVNAYFDDNQVELVKANVLGWQVGGERTMTPLVLDPGAVTGEDFHIIHADGRVECSDGRCWEDVDVWIAEERRLRRDGPSPEKAATPARIPHARVPGETGEGNRDAA